MDYGTMAYDGVLTILNYMGLDRRERTRTEVRHRRCPNCNPEGHKAFEDRFRTFSEIMREIGGPEGVDFSSEQCEKFQFRCPACTHGSACVERIKSRFEREFVDSRGRVRRFLSLADLADRVGVHLTTVRRWVAAGKLNAQNGLIRGKYGKYVDSENCPLLSVKQQQRPRQAKAA